MGFDGGSLFNSIGAALISFPWRKRKWNGKVEKESKTFRQAFHRESEQIALAPACAFRFDPRRERAGLTNRDRSKRPRSKRFNAST